MTCQTPSLSVANRQAWDSLYGRTPDPVWGRAPVGFLPHFLSDLQARLRPGAMVLDAATGEGRNLEALATLASVAVGADASRHALAKVPAGVRRQVKLASCDLYALPFKASAFDVVLASDVLETLPDVDVAVREIHRVLRPGGLFLCNIPDVDDGISGIDMIPVATGGYLFRGQYFFRFMSLRQAETLLATSGFDILRSQVISWQERPHPQFREVDHSHTSRVFLASKPLINP